MTVLLQYKAGICKYENNIVTSDPRKGFLIIEQDEESLIHLVWKERNKEQKELDLLLFPQDACLFKVPQCTTGRVWLLKFQTSNQKNFFWIQEPLVDKDEETFTKINELIVEDNKDNEIVTSNKRSSDSLDNSEAVNMLQNMIRQLTKILSPKNTIPIAKNKKYQDKLLEYLPEGFVKTEKELEENLNSPQFIQSVQLLEHALQEGDLPTILTQFGI
ncbi:hypothetical protein ROZALSC1DRAFT_29638, partial [Rozella allomycis CSF55]